MATPHVLGEAELAHAGPRRARAGAPTDRRHLTVIECGSLEYAQARLQSRHGQRATELQWQQLEIGARVRWLARRRARRPAAPLGRGPHRAGQRARDRSRAACALACGGGRNRRAGCRAHGTPRWPGARCCPSCRCCSTWRAAAHPKAGCSRIRAGASCARFPMASTTAVLARGPWRALASAWAAPDTLTHAWQAEWQRRLPQPLHDDDSLRLVMAAMQRHGAAFATATPGSGTPLRRALQARLVLLLRRATLEPAAAFIHLALSALELERLRGELLGAGCLRTRGWPDAAPARDPLVRDPCRARRRDAGARSAGAHRRGANSRRAAARRCPPTQPR